MEIDRKKSKRKRERRATGWIRLVNWGGDDVTGADDWWLHETRRKVPPLPSSLRQVNRRHSFLTFSGCYFSPIFWVTRSGFFISFKDPLETLSVFFFFSGSFFFSWPSSSSTLTSSASSSVTLIIYPSHSLSLSPFLGCFDLRFSVCSIAILGVFRHGCPDDVVVTSFPPPPPPSFLSFSLFFFPSLSFKLFFKLFFICLLWVSFIRFWLSWLFLFDFFFGFDFVMCFVMCFVMYWNDDELNWCVDGLRVEMRLVRHWNQRKVSGSDGERVLSELDGMRATVDRWRRRSELERRTRRPARTSTSTWDPIVNVEGAAAVLGIVRPCQSFGWLNVAPCGRDESDAGRYVSDLESVRVSRSRQSNRRRTVTAVIEPKSHGGGQKWRRNVSICGRRESGILDESSHVYQSILEPGWAMGWAMERGRGRGQGRGQGRGMGPAWVHLLALEKWWTTWSTSKQLGASTNSSDHQELISQGRASA